MAQSVSSDRNACKSSAVARSTQMSFKDWKMQKETQNKNNTTYKRRQEKSKGLSNNNIKNSMRPPPSLLKLNIEQNVFCNNTPLLFRRPPPPYPNNGFNYNDNGCGGNMDFRSSGFQNGMNLNGFGNSFSGNGYSGPNFSTGAHFRNTSTINSNLSDRFFQTDGFYCQKDMLKEPNPFRYTQRSNALQGNLNTSDRRKPKISVKSPMKRNEEQIKAVACQEPEQKLEPKIFVRNPNRKDIKKPFIPMPKHPESEPNLTSEERKQQWRDYREAMKPFKNKDFYNAKRVVQRLGKKEPSELDEKQKFRLTNAQEKMAEYKLRLAEKYDSYVKSADKSPNELGELFVLRKGNTQSHWESPDKTKLDQYKNYGNFGESYKTKANSDSRISSGRKILGGASNYS